jgi:hypothetical protein
MSEINFKFLQNWHETLLQKQQKISEENKQDFTKEVKDYTEQAKRGGSYISSNRERDQLRANLRYWANYIYSVDKTFPDIELAPSNVKGTPFWVTTFGILIMFILPIVLAAYFIVQTIQRSAQAVTEPFQQVNQANQTLQAQVGNLLHPTPTIIPDPVTYINEVRALARLETIQYSIEKVITGETGGGTFQSLFGDKILFVAHGTVIAGIDMEKLRPEDMRFENGVLYVRLPPSEIFIATLDNEKSYVLDRQTGAIRSDPNLETLVRQRAEEEIRKAAREDGILEQAPAQRRSLSLQVLAALGYPNTIFVDE